MHEKQSQSAVANDIKCSLYEDNVISECQSEDEILEQYTTARAIMNDAHFNLCSSVSNSSKLQAKAQVSIAH